MAMRRFQTHVKEKSLISNGANAAWCLVSSGWTLWRLKELVILMKVSADWDTSIAVLP